MKRNFIKNIAFALLICSATLIGGTAASAETTIATKTNQVSNNKKDTNSFIYDTKKLPENLKKLIPKGLEDKAVVKHVGKYNVDVITLPKSTEASSKTTSDSLTLDSVSGNGGIQYQDQDSTYKVLLRGVEDHGSGPHFNINTQYRYGGDIHDYHFTYEGSDSYSGEYVWKMSDESSDIEREIVGYGSEEDAAYSASYEMLETIEAEDGAEVEGLVEGGLPVFVELLLALLAL